MACIRAFMISMGLLLSNLLFAYQVTFQVNMQNVMGYTTPELNGTFNGWCGNCNAMTDANGDGVWQVTISLPAGQHEYKFSHDNWLGQEWLTPGSSCTLTSFGFTNRVIQVNSDVILPIVCWSQCSNCQPPVTYNWQLAWCDEFDGNAIRTDYWTHELGNWGWGNAEWQNYTAQSSNSFVSDGMLNIVARKEADNTYTSARLITKNKVETKYGKIEARLKLPMGQGIWPAFWMLGENIDQVSWPACGELDVMEHINSENKVYGTVHWDQGGHAYQGGNINTDPTQFHRYAMIWNDAGATFYVDDVPYYQQLWTSTNNTTPIFQRSFFLLLNVAVGGNWPGYPDGSTVFPATMQVDYVRIYQSEATPGFQIAAPLTTYYSDADADGYGNPTLTVQSCTQPSAYVLNNGDCNDSNASINPEANEVCNGLDDDCNGSIDPGLTSTYYRDADGDGYGNASLTVQACSAPSGYVNNSTDCNDSNASIRPGAAELCNNAVDDNCNGQINENCCTVSASASATSSSCVASANGSVNLTVSGGVTPFTFVWSNGATTEDLTAVAPGTYSVTVTDGNGCTANASAVVTNLGQTGPAAPTAISGPNGVCRNSTGNVFTVSPISGATSYVWTLPTGATGSSTTNTITLSFSSTYNTGNLCVRAVNACGTSASYCRSVAAYVTNPTTPGGISGPSVNVCAGTTQTYSIAAVSNATSYNWTAPAGATIASGQGTTTVTVSFSATFGTSGVLSVQSVNCFGSSTNRTLTIYKIPGTPATISGQSTSVCPGSTKTYTIASVTGATSYVWTAPANATIASGQGTTTVTVSFNSSFASGTLSVAAASTCGQSTARTLTVTKTPTVSAISGTASNLCGGGQFTYSVTAVTGASTYNWTVPAGCSIVTNNGNSIVMNVPSAFTTGTLTLVVTNTCGVSVTKTLALTALPATPASISGPASVCPNQTGVVFTTPAVTGVTQQWALPTGGVITAGQGTTTMTATWGSVAGTVTVRSINACGQSGTRGKSVSLLTCMTDEPIVDGEYREMTLEAFPNPNDGTFTVRSSAAGELVLMDELGRVIEQTNLTTTLGLQHTFTDLSAGVYFVRCTTEDGIRSKRVVVVE